MTHHAVDFDDRPDAHPFRPVGERLRYRPPPRGVDPDASKGWLRRLWPVVVANRRLFLTALSTIVIVVVLRTLLPRWIGHAVNDALAAPAGRRSQLAPYLWTIFGMAMAILVLGIVSRYHLYKAAYALEFDLRALMYRHLTLLSPSFYDRVQSGQLVSRANSDIRAVQSYLAFGPSILVQFLMLFIALYFMLSIHVGLTALSVAVLPLVYRYGARLRRFMLPISWIVQARTAEVATIVDENVTGVRVVKSFAAEEQQVSLLARAAQRLQWVATYQVRIRARYAPIIENIPRVGEAVVLLYGGFLVIDGRIGPGDVLVFMSYLVMLQAPFRFLGFLVTMAQRAAASAQRILEVLDEPPDIADRAGAVDLLDCEGHVEFRHVDFAYGGGPLVLHDFDFEMRAGETVALVGRTGSGKTTVAELLLRLYDVNGGAALVDGVDIRDITVASLRAHVGICFDDAFLFSASIHDNIAYGRLDATREEVEAAARAANADEFIVRLEHGYDTVVGERGYTLSGGQRQRIAIARTILENPQILIFDDATSAIDVKIELQIHDALQRLVSGRTTLIIAHRLSTIALADRVALIEGGRVVATGSHRDLMATEPRYAEVLAHLDEEDDIKAAVAEERARASHVVVDDAPTRLLVGDGLDGEGDL